MNQKLKKTKACIVVFCQFTSSPRDAASLATVSNMGTRSSSSSANRDIVSKIQISEEALAKRHTNRAWFNSPVQQPIHACGKWIRGQHTALPNTSLDFKPRAVSPTCLNTANRVVVQHSKQFHNLIRDTNLVKSSHNAENKIPVCEWCQ